MTRELTTLFHMLRHVNNNAANNPNNLTVYQNKYPYELIYYESYKHKADAKYRENNLKRFAQAYSQLKKRIKNSLE